MAFVYSFDIITMVAKESRPIMTPRWYRSTLCGQQLRSVVVLSCSLV